MPLEWLIVAGIGAAVAIGFGLNAYYNKRRQRQIVDLAAEWGFAYDRDGSGFAVGGLTHLQLFQQGRATKFANVLKGKLEDVDVAIFDYQYTTGSGKNKTTARQTVAAFHVPAAVFPTFTLRREHFFHKIGQLFGYKDIDFDAHPRFSKKYLLRGQDEQAIRLLFNDEIIRFFEELNLKLIVEAQGQWMIVYTRGKRIKPARLQDFLTQTWEVFLAFPTT